MWRHAGTVELSINLHVMPAAAYTAVFMRRQTEFRAFRQDGRVMNDLLDIQIVCLENPDSMRAIRPMKQIPVMHS